MEIMTIIEKIFLQLCKSKRLTVYKNGRVKNNETGNFLGSTLCRYGKISVLYDGVIRNILIHRLIYLIHIGPIPDGKTINHKDGNRQNNNIKNLECISFLENMRHAYKNNLINLSVRKEKVCAALRKPEARKKLKLINDSRQRNSRGQFLKILKNS